MTMTIPVIIICTKKYCSHVELLLEYGYTCDEIEDMLSDHDLLHEALRDVKYMCGEDVYESYCGVF